MEVQCEEAPSSAWTSETSVRQCLLQQYMRGFKDSEDSEATVGDGSNPNDNLKEKSQSFIASDKNNKVWARKSVTGRKVAWKKMSVKEPAMDSEDYNRAVGVVTRIPVDCTPKDALGCLTIPWTTEGHDQKLVLLGSQCPWTTSRVSFKDGRHDLNFIPVSTPWQLTNGDDDDEHDPIITNRVQDKPLRRFRRYSERHPRRYRPLLLRHVYTSHSHKSQLVLSDQLQQWDRGTGLLLGLRITSGNDEAVTNEIDSPLHEFILRSKLRIRTDPELQSSATNSRLLNNQTLNVTLNIYDATDGNKNNLNDDHTTTTDSCKSVPPAAGLLDIASITKRAIQSINSRLGFGSNWFNLLDRLGLWFCAVLALWLATAAGVGGGDRVRLRKKGVHGKEKDGGLHKLDWVDIKERRRMGSTSTLLLFLMVLAFGSCASACNQDACTNSFVSMKSQHDISEGHNPPYCTLLRRYHECTSALSTACRGDLKYHSHLRVINSLLAQHRCALLQEDPSLASSMDMRSDDHGDNGGGGLQGGGLDGSVQRRDEPLDECDFAGPVKPRAHCGLFGDPHLRTFQGEFVTCRVLGAWPLLDTPDLAVQVTNQRVGEDLHATATTKVTAIIKGRDRCGPGRTYEASTDQLLPKAFVDGTSAGGGPDPARPAVWVKEVVSGQHIEIRIRYINATVSVRRIDKYLAVSATLPRAVAATGEELGLCVTGCPPSEMLDAPLATAMPEDKALQLCSHYNLTDYFLDSCVFDLMTTGDSYFRQAAAAAQAELWTQDPIAAASTLRNCTQWPCQWQISNSTTATSRVGLCSIIFLVLAMFTISKIVATGL